MFKSLWVQKNELEIEKSDTSNQRPLISDSNTKISILLSSILKKLFNFEC